MSEPGRAEVRRGARHPLLRPVYSFEIEFLPEETRVLMAQQAPLTMSHLCSSSHTPNRSTNKQITVKDRERDSLDLLTSGRRRDRETTIPESVLGFWTEV